MKWPWTKKKPVPETQLTKIRKLRSKALAQNYRPTELLVGMEEYMDILADVEISQIMAYYPPGEARIFGLNLVWQERAVGMLIR